MSASLAVGGQWRNAIEEHDDGIVHDFTQQHPNREHTPMDGGWHRYWQYTPPVTIQPGVYYRFTARMVGKLGNDTSSSFRYNWQTRLYNGSHYLTENKFSAERFSGMSGWVDGTVWHNQDFTDTINVNYDEWTTGDRPNIELWWKGEERDRYTETYQASWQIRVQTWTKRHNLWITDGGRWKQATNVYVVDSGRWKEVSA